MVGNVSANLMLWAAAVNAAPLAPSALGLVAAKHASVAVKDP